MTAEFTPYVAGRSFCARHRTVWRWVFVQEDLGGRGQPASNGVRPCCCGPPGREGQSSCAGVAREIRGAELRGHFCGNQEKIIPVD